MNHNKILEKKNIISCIAKARLPTRFGPFELYLYHDHMEKIKKDHIVLVKGNIKNKSGVLTRIHSECLTGDVFGSQRCDCEEQLHSALESISNENEGILLYLRQEGRGIGLINKILAYELQDRGLNTITANEALGLPVDSRDYSLAVAILDDLKVKSVRLLTNNPKKLEVFESAHIPCVERIPIVIHANPYNNQYLEIKRDIFGHYLTPRKMEIFDNVNTGLSLIKFIYFFDESKPHFELSNFGAKDKYANQHGDEGEYSEITYQFCKFYYLDDKEIATQLRNKFSDEVSHPDEAFHFMQQKRSEINNKSINEVISENGWLSENEYQITNKELEMLFCLLNKFDPSIHPELFRILNNAVNNNKIVLVEANPEDDYWGYKNGEESQSQFGKNRFGLILTAIAHTIKNQKLVDIKLSSKNNLIHIIHKYRELVTLFDGFNFHV